MQLHLQKSIFYIELNYYDYIFEWLNYDYILEHKCEHLMCCIDFAMCRPMGTFPHPLSCVKQQTGYWVMDPPAFCQVFFHNGGNSNLRVFLLHICLDISVVLGFFYKLLFLFHTVGVCTHALMLKVLWDPSSFEGSHESVVQGMFYKARNYCSRHCLLKMHGVVATYFIGVDQKCSHKPMTICMVKTVCNHIKKLWEKLCLILLQIDVKSYWRFWKKVDNDACKIYGKLSCSFTADLVKMDGHCCFISNSISIGVS